jgi:hypothetical protein
MMTPRSKIPSENFLMSPSSPMLAGITPVPTRMAVDIVKEVTKLLNCFELIPERAENAGGKKATARIGWSKIIGKSHIPFIKPMSMIRNPDPMSTMDKKNQWPTRSDTHPARNTTNIPIGLESETIVFAVSRAIPRSDTRYSGIIE